MLKITRRKFVASAVSIPLALSFGSSAPLLAANSNDEYWFVNPELRPAAKKVKAIMTGLPRPEDLPNFKLALATAFKPAVTPLPTVPFKKVVASGRKGNPDVTLYVINAKEGGSRPGILHMHGGGFIIGSAWDRLKQLQELSFELDCAIVTVDYRLAPETRYFGSIEDNYTGLLWLKSNAKEIGVDVSRLAVLGESAGGGHAALLAITARDRGEIPLAFQALVYPMLDDRTVNSPPSQEFVGSLVWTREANRVGWRSFLGQEPGTDKVDARGVPARVEDVQGLPPAWIGVGSIDLFASENMQYAKRLMDAGIATELNIVPGAFHGFDNAASDTPLAKKFGASKVDALRRALGA